MARLRLHGTGYSVYVRIARLVLEELGISYEHVPLDVFEDPDAARALHPFAKIPVLVHDGWQLYETDAIAHYLIALQPQPELLPPAPKGRARTLQIMRIMDSYAYPHLVWGVYVAEREEGLTGDRLDAAMTRAATVLDVLEDFAETGDGLRTTPTLADLWAYPMLTYFALSPSGSRLLPRYKRLHAWMHTMSDRNSARQTRFPDEAVQG